MPRMARGLTAWPSLSSRSSHACAARTDNSARIKPKRRPIPDRVPRIMIESLPETDDCVACGGRLRRVGEDVTEELEYGEAE